MKVKITYAPDEKRKALSAISFFRELLPGVRVKTDDKNPEYAHFYLADANGKRKQLDAHK